LDYSRRDSHQKVFGFHVLPWRDQEFYNAAGDGCVDIRLHFHGFEGQEFRSALDWMIRLHGDSADYTGSRRCHLARIRGVCFRMGALDDA
jgi:hypothetical protein